ncbi:hypothetical protein M9Y10_023989 [Tritrichomonas musculus]|uniref:Right handed beta helix domain-containing protein n=1 Tax=Tritrichomonas musculus TaxID=1915356 RepID=A0ABR2KWP4_9EUKA
MFFYLLAIYAQGIKIHQNYYKSSSTKKENGICPTYYPGLYITSSCQSFGMNYTKGSAEPAYRADSRKAGFSITLDNCNYSKYIVSSGYFFSLINVNGSRTVKLNVNSCRFVDNKMTYSQTGVFFLSNGQHELTINKCTFLGNQGKQNSILGETCSKLIMSDCYLAKNIANHIQGQIHIKSLKNSKYSKSNEDVQLNFSNLIFYMNIGWPYMNVNNIMLLEDYTSISFKNCSFTCGSGESKNMIGLKGKGIEISFTDCCFFVNYTFYYNYYHIFFDYGSSGFATFSGKNSFSGSKENSINKNLAETDEEVYNIEKCFNDIIEPTPTQTETDIIISPSIRPSITEIIPTQNFTFPEKPSSSEIVPTQNSTFSKKPSASEIVPTESPSSSSSSSGGGSDSDGGSSEKDGCKDGIVMSIPFFVLLLVLFLLLLVLAFILGWHLAKRQEKKERENTSALRSDLLYSQNME